MFRYESEHGFFDVDRTFPNDTKARVVCTKKSLDIDEKLLIFTRGYGMIKLPTINSRIVFVIRI